MDHQFEEDGKMVLRLKISKYLSKGKKFLAPTFSLSPLCPRTSKCLSMEEEVGTMQIRVYGEQKKECIKKRTNKKKKKYV
jgi:hypothetical protein